MNGPEAFFGGLAIFLFGVWIGHGFTRAEYRTRLAEVTRELEYWQRKMRRRRELDAKEELQASFKGRRNHDQADKDLR